MDDLGLLLEELLDVRVLWYHLGMLLKVRIGTLDNIHVQFTDPSDRLLEMLQTWLTTSDNPSWITLTHALKSVGEDRLADVLEAKYCPMKGKQ